MATRSKAEGGFGESGAQLEEWRDRSYNFSDLISPNPKDVKFTRSRRTCCAEIQSSAKTTYGLEVELVGIKQLGLPLRGITTKVFERMRASGTGW